MMSRPVGGVKPEYWKCCHCAAIHPCSGSRENRVPPLPKHVSHPPEHCASDCETSTTELCADCHGRRCPRCVFLNAAGDEVQTVGGKNLLADRFEPAGWRCCCGSEYYLEPGGGDDDGHIHDSHFLVDVILSGDDNDSDDYNSVDASTHRLQHTCRRGGHRHRHHQPCVLCRVLNRHGEPIGWVGERSRLLLPLPDASPLARHLECCEEEVRSARRAAAANSPVSLESFLRWPWARLEDAVAAHRRLNAAVRAAKNSRVARAEKELREAELALEGVVSFATELWGAASALRRGNVAARLR